MKILAFWALWAGCYFLPPLAGQWYDSLFHVYQALISLLLLYAVDRLCRGWWIPDFKALCCYHILHNVADAYQLIPTENYNHLQFVLNMCELSLITIGPISIWLREVWRGRSANTRGSDRGPTSRVAPTDGR